MRKRTLIKISIIIATIVIISSIWRSSSPLLFDERQWKEARHNNNLSIMYRMSEDLAQRLNAHKSSSQAVLDQLGSPDRDGGFFYQYRLGKHRSFPLFVISDQWWLTIEFKNQQVHNVKVNAE